MKTQRITGAKKAALTAVAVAAAAGVAFGSAQTIGALFTSQATVEGQSVKTGTVEISPAFAANSDPIDVSGLLPGDTVSTTLDVSNTGSADLYYTVRLNLDGATDTALATALQVKVTAGSYSATQTLGAWPGSTMEVATPIDAGERIPVTIEVTLPLSAANTLQGTSATFDVQFDATQKRNNPAEPQDRIITHGMG
ncbi:hypothetical protein [Microbacterium album]|uniref:Camelysin metallo-endopeptidase n=1 Tax=Microbacterium album TaxID=2053191 RepID=A0A917MKW1_9MICO|nr:hypothetical protein [Microbacterium album]GGH38760.1 hypothetical protein GCM10010921_09540 [Microbacterium album]